MQTITVDISSLLKMKAIEVVLNQYWNEKSSFMDSFMFFMKLIPITQSRSMSWPGNLLTVVPDKYANKEKSVTFPLQFADPFPFHS